MNEGFCGVSRRASFYLKFPKQVPGVKGQSNDRRHAWSWLQNALFYDYMNFWSRSTQLDFVPVCFWIDLFCDDMWKLLKSPYLAVFHMLISMFFHH